MLRLANSRSITQLRDALAKNAHPPVFIAQKLRHRDVHLVRFQSGLFTNLIARKHQLESLCCVQLLAFARGIFNRRNSSAS